MLIKPGRTNIEDEIDTDVACKPVDYRGGIGDKKSEGSKRHRSINETADGEKKSLI